MDQNDWADLAVENGVAYLNEKAPEGWQSLIDVESLDIFSPDLCVLGQVFAEKATECMDQTGYNYIFDLEGIGSGSGFSMVKHGFCAGEVDKGNPESWVGISTMTAAWRKYLAFVQ